MRRARMKVRERARAPAHLRADAQVSERFAVPRGTPWGPLGPTWYVFYIVMFYPSTGISVISGDS